MNTNIQFLPVLILDTNNQKEYNYYIANILELVDSICLEKSEYFKTEIVGLDTIHTISKFAVYESGIQNADIFKLKRRQEIPIFVSEKFKAAIETNHVLGIYLREIMVS